MKLDKELSGFTLIEILVCLIIIALSVSIISLSTKSLQARNELQPFVDNLYQRLNNLEQDAMLRQVEIGLNIYTNKIEILNYKSNFSDSSDSSNFKDNTTAQWKLIKTISVPSKISLKYEILESDLFKKLTTDSLNSHQPDVIITSGGYMTPFKLMITHPDEQIYYIISSQFSGEINLITEKGG